FPEELNVMGDPERLRTILSNLLSNAIKYSPDGGDIHITLARDQEVGRVTVADSGVGIPPEYQSRLFSAFTRVARDDLRYVPGTGISRCSTRARPARPSR